MNEKRKIFTVIIMMLALVIVLCVAVGSLIHKSQDTWQKEKTEREPDTTGTVTDFPPSPTKAAKYPYIDSYLAKRMNSMEQKKNLEAEFGTAYDGVWTLTNDSMSCIVEKNGMWGMVSVTGEILVPVQFERFSFMDNTGWVEFEKDGRFFVYGEQGTLIREYTDKTDFRLESEEGYLYRTTKAYMSGMEITVIVPEITGTDYYGVEYRNKESGEVLYRAVGGYEEAGIFTFPDQSGRAVAIQGDGYTNTIYYITKDGCESRVMELPEGINGRWFDFMGDYAWADVALSHGWVKVFVSDAVPDFLMDSYENYYAFLNVDTLELVPFPKEYQEYFTIYNSGYGKAVAFRTTTKEDNTKYAVCVGSDVLTEELYYWVEFEENCILCGGDNGVDIFDYSGNLLHTYQQVSGSFPKGRMLVWDENGLYFIDEQLEKCSDYLLTEKKIDRLFSRGVVLEEQYYILEEFAMEELPEQGRLAEKPQPTVVPEPTKVPVYQTEDEYRIVEVGYEICSSLKDAYIIWQDDGYGVADLSGNVVVEPKYESWVYSEEERVSFEDSEGITHMFDCSGKELYTYVCNQGSMTNESGQQFSRAVYYRRGMRIEYDFNYEDAYYGVHYYNAETGALIFELTDEMCQWETNPRPDFQVASMPDETGMAVVIAGNGVYNTMYKITKDGYTEETYQEEHVERRIFHPSDHVVWDFAYLSNGWLLTTVCEERGDLLYCEEDWYQMLFNVHTKERIILPKQYQIWYGEYWVNSKGVYYGMSGESRYDYENGETDCIYYAICHGNEQLTEELYEWIDFGEKYIIAGNSSFSHILNYEGEVLAEYYDVAFPFVDGKTLVVKFTGQAYYIDEDLCYCTHIVKEDVYFGHINYVCSENGNFLIQWKEKKE